jgi:hypothetical protein
MTKELEKSTSRVMKRNAVLAEVAKAAGWSNWSEYQTAVIHGQVGIEGKNTPVDKAVGAWVEFGINSMYNVNAA